MKKLIAVAALVATFTAYGHTMSPIFFGGKNDPMNSISLTGVVVVPITIGSKSAKDFLITVDEEEVDQIHVPADEKRKASIPVKLNNPNTVEEHKVCSLGLGKTFNTKICTRVKAYWLKKD